MGDSLPKISFSEWLAARNLATKQPDMGEVRRFYEDEMRSAEEIGETYGVSGRTVGQWLKKMGVRLRDPSEVRRARTLRERYKKEVENGNS